MRNMNYFIFGDTRLQHLQLSSPVKMALSSFPMAIFPRYTFKIKKKPSYVFDWLLPCSLSILSTRDPIPQIYIFHVLILYLQGVYLFKNKKISKRILTIASKNYYYIISKNYYYYIWNQKRFLLVVFVVIFPLSIFIFKLYTILYFG